MNNEKIKQIALQYEVDEKLVVKALETATKLFKEKGLSDEEASKYLPRRIESCSGTCTND